MEMYSLNNGDDAVNTRININDYAGTLPGFFNAEGELVKKTKFTHPYSYDQFVMWNSGSTTKVNHTLYSDRLLQWDYDKHNELCRKHFGDEGQYWDRRDAAKIEAFLRDYLDHPELELIRILEGCNISNGYPYWVFLCHTEDNTSK